jgi:hypothetical protein
MLLIQKSGNPDIFAGEEDNPKSDTFDRNNVTVCVENP